MWPYFTTQAERKQGALPLRPCKTSESAALGLTIPLVIGTPIAYWMRYIVALHYLLPVWLVILGLKKENSLPESSK